MKKTGRYKLIIFLLLFINNSFAQKIELQATQQLNIDHLENIYITDKDNFTLISSQKEYQNNFLGDIFSIDISNPLRILVFHKDANQIVFLNNQLSIIGNAIILDEINLANISVVCASQTNGFWVYNNLNNRIEYFNRDLQKTHSSIDLSSRIDSPNNIQEIKMDYRKIYLKVKNIGILVFDLFGTYIKTIPLKKINSFQILNNSILYTQSKQVLIYNMNKLNITTLYQSKFPIKYAKIINNHLYLLEENKLMIRTLNTSN